MFGNILNILNQNNDLSTSSQTPFRETPKNVLPCYKNKFQTFSFQSALKQNHRKYYQSIFDKAASL